MDKFIGKTLNDRYILTEIIGVGGMAIVYKAFDRVVNRVVAVKILKEEFMSDAQFRRRFTNESRAITMLSQNNIVDVYDVCLEGDLMYIVMEYIDGITLKEYIDKVKILDWKEAAFYIKQILKAMSHAHERGIVHRDLKPHNIMLLRDGTIKVTDFGIAKLSKFDTQTITDKAIGSVHYISPEQASGDRTDEKTDIYSVGVMFYEMITGTLPFIADSPVSVALMQVQAQPTLPRDIKPEIPEGIEEIVIKAMMKSPDMRYSSALEMFNDILSVEDNSELSFGYLDSNDDEEQVEQFQDYPTQNVSFVMPEDLQNDYAENDEQYDNYDEQDYQKDQEADSKFKEIWLPIIAGVGTAILVGIFVVLGVIFFPEIKDTVMNSDKVVEMVTVQNYVGQDYETVLKENATGLKFEKENELSDLPEGQIISQDPPANTEVEKGSTITFKVSVGKETVQIPDLKNKYFTDATDELFELGIAYKTTYISSDSVKKDYVIKTNPKAYTEIQSDTVVTVYISSGPDIVTVEVPSLEKRTVDDAVKKLSEKNLKADKLYEYSDSIPKDCVISQNPEAGTMLEEGESVEIVISLGPKPDEEETTEPDEDSKEPDDGNTNPDDGNTNPDDGNTTNPDDGNTNPDNGNTTNPDSGNTTNPDDDSSTNTDGGATNPDGTTTNPDSGTTNNSNGNNSNTDNSGKNNKN